MSKIGNYIIEHCDLLGVNITDVKTHIALIPASFKGYADDKYIDTSYIQDES